MRRWVEQLISFDHLSPEVAWRLVDTLFQQRTPIVVGASIFMMVAIAAYIGTGSPWYLAGFVYTFGVFLWRFRQTLHYARRRDSATPVAWAWQNARSGWATAAAWGAWSAVVCCETQKSIVVLTVAVNAGLIGGGAVRNSAVPAVSVGQAILAIIPMLLACLASGDPYLQMYAFIAVLHFISTLSTIKMRHQEMLALLLSEQEKSNLLGRLATANQELEVANRELELLATTDALTNIANRRAFDLLSMRECRLAAREETSLAMLMLDIDHFKAFNDFYGHQHGDACLRDVAAAIGTVLRRPTDTLARYGGEEFAVVLPGTTLAGAVQVAERIIKVLDDNAFPHASSPFGRVTVSIGVASIKPQPHTPVDRLIELADAALYSAKRSGRNRWHGAGESTASEDSKTISAAQELSAR